MRILKGWTENERKELEKAKDNYFVSAIELIKGITGNDDDCIYLAGKYAHESPYEDNQLVRDIVDYYNGEAKFPDKKYYVKLIRNNDSSYLNRSTSNGFCMACCYQPDEIFQTEFTEQEIKDIDPRYMAFAVSVEENIDD